jgi:uncharacterized metal-binding protein YceD (DUF177 family)
MMKKNNKSENYQIRFTSLKDGHHQFTFKVRQTFFDQIDYTDIKNADVTIEVDLDKQPTMMIAKLNLSGNVTVMCDRCTDDVNLPIETDEDLIFKFTNVDLEDENVIAVHPNEIDIDLKQSIYEFIALAIPNKRLHSEGNCNQDMLKEINQYLLIDEEVNDSDTNDSNDVNKEETDPRWAALNKLKFKK